MDEATAAADDPLERVLEPVSVADFFERYWERQPLHLEREEPGRFAPLVSSARIERLLGNAALRYPDVQLARVDDPIAAEEYTDEDGRIVPQALARAHAAGATVVMSGADERLDALGELCRRARTRFGMRCQTNVYLSPPGSRGFGPHHDSHDVFILQVEGEKTFRFHAGGPELPLARDRFDPGRDAAGEPTEEIVLAAGDTLYIPRGLMHDALASGDGASLHVTLGVFPMTVLDVLHEALDVAASGSLALRRSVTGRHAAPWRSEGDRLLDDPPAALRDALPASAVREAIEALRDAFALASRPDAAGLLAPPADVGTLPDETEIVVRADVPTRAERRGERLVLALPGQLIELGEPMAAAAEALLAARRLRVGDLPGLEHEGRQSLCRHLLRERVVSTA